jgi:hypothetical protein
MMTDPAERIVNLMADGRERTTNDIAVKLAIPPDALRPYLIALSKHGKRKKIGAKQITSEGKAISIWRAV